MSLINTLRFILNHPLASRNKIRALSRFTRWQIGSRLNPYPVVYPFVGDTKLVVESGMTGATGNIYTGLHEFSDMGFLLHFLNKDDLFVDVGANIGSYSVLASGICKAKSISIEPSSYTFNRLTRNILINNIEKKVKALNIGLGAGPTSMLFTKSLDTINHIVENDNGKTENVEEIKIDSLDNIIGDNFPNALLKIDVEGFETEVMKGAKSTLVNNNLKAVIIELNGSGCRYGFNEIDIHNTFINNGFRPYYYEPLSRDLIELKIYGSHNTIYIRDVDFVKERLMNSPKIKILDTIF